MSKSACFSVFLVLLSFGIAYAILPFSASAQDGATETAEVVAEGGAEAEAAPEEEAPPEAAALDDVNTLWTCLAAFLVFFMQAGFGLVETGLTRAKNAVNIMMKNFTDFAIGSVGYWLIGFGVMFGLNSTGWFGTTDFFYETDNSFNWAFFIFQTVFCATAATIVSGAMAERTKFISYVIYSAAISIIVYPIFGSWAWNSLSATDGSGWLEGFGFHDFAGSTVVHSVGGWCALAGAIVVGPRLGKFVKGKAMPIPGHNLPMAALGVFVLWLGWFGFNPGSTTAVGGGSFAYIAVTTNMAAAGGALAALVTSWIVFKKPDISFTCNGALAGLVAITAGCDAISVPFSLLTGAIAGVLVVFAVLLFDKLKIDDPVGAISVHGVNGAWGTLAVGLFMKPGIVEGQAGLLLGGGLSQLVPQLVGIAAAFLWAFPVSLGIFFLLKYTVGLRVSREEEIEGLDIHEHGAYAYPPSFVIDPLVGTLVEKSTSQKEPSAVPALAGSHSE